MLLGFWSNGKLKVERRKLKVKNGELIVRN